MLKVVVDTNIILSSIFWSGQPYQLLKKIKQGRIEAYISDSILEEIEEALREFRVKLPEAKIKEIINEIALLFNLIKPGKCFNISEHDKDNKFIECAVEADANYIITGDKHLLKVKKFKDIEMISVSDFLEKF